MQPLPPDFGFHESIYAVLNKILENQEQIMAAMDNLVAADTALKTEVAQVIADWQAALAAAGTASPQIQAVADDMTNFVAQLKAADPAVVVTPPAPTA